MVISAIVLFVLAALLGLVLLTYVLKNKETPKGLAFSHGTFAAIALIILIIYAYNNLDGHSHFQSIILFIIAAIGGFIMIARDLLGKTIPKWLAIAHGAIALSGVLLLIIHTFFHY